MATVETATTLPNYIGGRFTDVEGVEALEDHDPASGELLARVPLSDSAAVDAAVKAARAAAPQWRAVPVQRRARVVLALREALLEHRDELARLVATDMGKTLEDA